MPSRPRAMPTYVLPFTVVEVVGCQHLHHRAWHHLSERWQISDAVSRTLSVSPSPGVLKGLSVQLHGIARHQHQNHKFVHLNSLITINKCSKLPELITQQNSLHQWSKSLQTFTLYISDNISGGFLLLGVEEFGRKHIKSHQNNWSDCARIMDGSEKGRDVLLLCETWNNWKANWMKIFSLHPLWGSRDTINLYSNG